MLNFFGLAGAIKALFGRKSEEEAAAVAAEAPAPVEVSAAEEVSGDVAPGSAGKLKLHNVPPKTAAMLMAIVANTTGKPLNELRFTSIREVKE